MYGSSFKDGNGIFQRNHNKSEGHGDNLHNGEFDNDCDEYSNLG
jgi:hypothetical protein